MKEGDTVNVYDFDGTIYHGDSTIDFYRFAVRSHPTLLRYLPIQAVGFLLYMGKRIDKTRLKEFFFSFLAGVDGSALTQAFWDQHQSRIYSWYLRQQRPDDIVISASPDFLLRPLCERLGIKNLIASEVDIKTGRFLGKNCRGAEKVLRLQRELGIHQIDAFYSDSASDLPMAQLAKHAFWVRKGQVSEWKAEGAG